MKSVLTLLITALFAIQAQAAIAFLVGHRMGQGVTGMPVLVCTYQYGNQKFDRAFPMGSFCPPTVDVQ